MSKEKLILCPFCGQKAEYGYQSSGPVNEEPFWQSHSVDCTMRNCFASMSGKTKEQVTKRWNRRV